ncbi:hypothetical protein CASFOL_029626 [Castilleja foliolosa]|uniref:FLZ-type domain-containing protein n=1 Tax=Castilleja foliolosa TaxID=1961234 RepID=A0ABD3C927_9LAMI
MALKRRPNFQVVDASDIEADAVGDPSQSAIFTIGCSIRVVDLGRWKFGGFLERCKFCTKRIAQSADVFMYGNLGAFCTVECREIQIAIDRMVKKQRAKSKEMMVCNQDQCNEWAWASV